jgi:hypothetical protein
MQSATLMEFTGIFNIYFFSFFTSMSLAKPNNNEYILEKNTSLDARTNMVPN